MKAIIRWAGGETVIEDCELGDPRVAEELDRLAKARVADVRLEFPDDFDLTDHEREKLVHEYRLLRATANGTGAKDVS